MVTVPYRRMSQMFRLHATARAGTCPGGMLSTPSLPASTRAEHPHVRIFPSVSRDSEISGFPVPCASFLFETSGYFRALYTRPFSTFAHSGEQDFSRCNYIIVLIKL